MLASYDYAMMLLPRMPPDAVDTLPHGFVAGAMRTRKRLMLPLHIAAKAGVGAAGAMPRHAIAAAATLMLPMLPLLTAPLRSRAARYAATFVEC